MKWRKRTHALVRADTTWGQPMVKVMLIAMVIGLLATGCGSSSPSAAPDSSTSATEPDKRLEEEVAGLRADLTETNRRVDDLEARVEALEAGGVENPEPEGEPPFDPLTPTVREDLYPNTPEELAAAAPVPSGLQVLSIESGDSPSDGDSWTGVIVGATEEDALLFAQTQICENGWLGRENIGNPRGYKQEGDLWWEVSIVASVVSDARVGGASIPEDVPDDAVYMIGLIRTTAQLNVSTADCGSES